MIRSKSRIDQTLPQEKISIENMEERKRSTVKKIVSHIKVPEKIISFTSFSGNDDSIIKSSSLPTNEEKSPLKPQKQHSRKAFSTRGRVWKVICNIDQLKQEMLDKFNRGKGRESIVIKKSCVFNRELEQKGTFEMEVTNL